MVFCSCGFDRLEVIAKVRNGGYLQPVNYDSGPASSALNPKQYYTGSLLTKQANFIFDFEPPIHCSLSSACNDNMLDIGAPYTKEVHYCIECHPYSIKKLRH